MIKILETRIEEVEIKVTAHCCDVCESQLGYIEKEDDSHERLHEETAKINFNFGYLSHNRDGDQGEFILCQECAVDLHQHLKTLSPNFKLINYMSDSLDSYGEAFNED